MRTIQPNILEGKSNLTRISSEKFRFARLPSLENAVAFASVSFQSCKPEFLVERKVSLVVADILRFKCLLNKDRVVLFQINMTSFENKAAAFAHSLISVFCLFFVCFFFYFFVCLFVCCLFSVLISSSVYRW